MNAFMTEDEYVLINALQLIGKIAGRPTTHYASVETQLEQQTRKLSDIAEIVMNSLEDM